MDYSFTITLKPIMFKKDIDLQFDETSSELYFLLGTLSTKFTCVAELTQSMNIHYHGIIHGVSKRKFVNTFRNQKKFGFVCYKEIFDLNGWKLYISKDITETYKDLIRRPIIVDNYDVFSLEQRAFYAVQW